MQTTDKFWIAPTVGGSCWHDISNLLMSNNIHHVQETDGSGQRVKGSSAKIPGNNILAVFEIYDKGR